MPFEQTEHPEVTADEVGQIRSDLFQVGDRDGRYLDQLTSAERGAFDRLRKKGLAKLEPQSKLDEMLGVGKIRVNDTALVRVAYETPLHALELPLQGAAVDDIVAPRPGTCREA